MQIHLATAVRSLPLHRAATRLSSSLNSLIRQNFGLLIAYILPGFVVMSGAAFLFPAVRNC